MDERTVDYYERHASEVASRYEEVESPLTSLFPVVFRKGQRVLDIGIGSGRDIALLLKNDIDAFGIEPSEALIYAAQKHHPELAGKLTQGALPRGICTDFDQHFDGILLSAVLMHIDDSELFDSAICIRRMLRPGGSLVISIPVQRDDIADNGIRDNAGRLMIIRSVPQVQLLFEGIGFKTASILNSADKAGRSGISWATLWFEYSGTSRSESLNRIETIINHDSKTATYKLALLRAMCDVAQYQTSNIQWMPSGEVGIPIDLIAGKWIEYYWPVVQSSVFMPQKYGERRDGGKGIAFRRPLLELCRLYENSGGLSAFLVQRDSNPGSLPDMYKTVLSKVRETIHRNPVYYAGGGNSDNKPFRYDSKRKHVLMDGELWREFSLIGHLVQDSVVFRWAEESVNMSRGNISTSLVLSLLLSTTDADRNVLVASNTYRAVNDLHCVWSGNAITDFHVDHAIPFSLWRDNSLWNLLPSDPSVNSRKQARLPALDLIGRQKDLIVYYWGVLKDAYEDQFFLDAGKIAPKTGLSPDNWEYPLYNGFARAVETTAIRRGAPRFDL